MRVPQQHVTLTHGTKFTRGIQLSQGLGEAGWQRLLLTLPEQWGGGVAALRWQEPNTQEGSARAVYLGQGIRVSPSACW